MLDTCVVVVVSTCVGSHARDLPGSSPFGSAVRLGASRLLTHQLPALVITEATL